ncbi:cysteine and glycine-rich protein 2 binding protein [Holotrichia oblita]|uniref:Cysteine and glycine-rich protein 2 binding protein n=1 Tax=Holotrichia oblita TaxID=644536 RepID=A0ACB9TPP1_HOLOL|nr:cysteine and glycine-rich protein 2 binding protein [Holotrichia oblita]
MERIKESCKYCESHIESIVSEHMTCDICKNNVHLRCLKKGSVPGGLSGDVFYTFTCEDCSTTGSETFERDKMPWLQAILLVLHHMQTRAPGLARKGFFHWKIHIATFINKYWHILFNKDFKRKKKWMGTISGTLSHYNPHIFLSGTLLFNDQGWWTLTYPKLPPSITMKLNSEFLIAKQKYKDNKILMTDQAIFNKILNEKQLPPEFLTKVSISEISQISYSDDAIDDAEYIKIKIEPEVTVKHEKNSKKTPLLPSLEKLSAEPSKRSKKKNVKIKIKDELTPRLLNSNTNDNGIFEHKYVLEIKKEEQARFMDPFCHYNTSLSNLANKPGIPLKIKLTGNVREDLILSPYSGLNLKPYICRDSSTFPHWLQLMSEILIKANEKNENWRLPPRGPIDYTYIQPSHIPAINSLCNQFFWPGIDLTECLQYPDFSCVVLYKKLIVGFALLVPNVKFNESYMSFIFTRPGWRNAGIGKFMIYHLIQVTK